MQCAGIHRTIDSNQIRSFRLDDAAWSHRKNVDFLCKIGGNLYANRTVWEYHFPRWHLSPRRDRLEHEAAVTTLRSLIIRRKYAEQCFTPISRSKLSIHRNGQQRERLLHIRKMPEAVRQYEVYFMDLAKFKWRRKADFGLLAGHRLSRYSVAKLKPKKCRHLEAHKLVDLVLVVDDVVSDDAVDKEGRKALSNSDGEFYSFRLYRDSAYSLKQHGLVSMNSMDDTKENGIGARPEDDDEDDVEQHDVKRLVVAVGTNDLKQFIKMVHAIRSTISYHRLLSELNPFQGVVQPKPPPMVLMNYNIQSGDYLGSGKLWHSQKLHFMIIEDALYGFKTKKDPRTLHPEDDKMASIPAEEAWNLQHVDALLDADGLRTGHKSTLLLIDGPNDRTIFIKCLSGPEAVMFFTKISGATQRLRGCYKVNFAARTKDGKRLPPSICGEGGDDDDDGNGVGADEQKDDAVFDAADPNQQRGRQRASTMQRLRTKSVHERCPTQILEIIADLELNADSDAAAQQMAHNEVVYEYAPDPAQGQGLMALPAPPPEYDDDDEDRGGGDENYDYNLPQINPPPALPPPNPFGL